MKKNGNFWPLLKQVFRDIGRRVDYIVGTKEVNGDYLVALRRRSGLIGKKWANFL